MTRTICVPLFGAIDMKIICVLLVAFSLSSCVATVGAVGALLVVAGDKAQKVGTVMQKLP